MRLRAEQHYMLEMCMIDVGVDSEQPFENHLDDVHEVFGERDAESTREYFLVVQLILDPGHQELDVLTRADLQRCLDIVAIGPEVFVLGSGAHGRTALSCAELHENAVENVDFVVEFDRVDGEPLVQVFTGRQLNSKLHVSAAERHACNLLELVTASTLLDLLLLLERFCFVEASQRFALLLFHFYFEI